MRIQFSSRKLMVSTAHTICAYNWSNENSWFPNNESADLHGLEIMHFAHKHGIETMKLHELMIFIQYMCTSVWYGNQGLWLISCLTNNFLVVFMVYHPIYVFETIFRSFNVVDIMRLPSYWFTWKDYGLKTMWLFQIIYANK